MASRIGKARPSGQPAGATIRKIGILLDLIRARQISLQRCMTTYGSSDRTILRDLQELREIGETAGFRIGEREAGGVFRLSEFKARPGALVASEKRLRGIIAELFKAFGEPVKSAADGFSAGASDGTNFLHVIQPQLMDGSAVANVYNALDAAWQNDARVEFRYRGEARTIEPAAAIVRSGRYYLVGRDVAKGKDGWRTFSMDLIGGPIRRVGTFARRAPPARYLSTDTIGFFKGDGAPHDVDVTFSKAVAPSAISRKWQAAQKVKLNVDGTVTISLVVDDVDEVIRWAFGYGDDAWIVAPAAVVERAKAMLDRARAHY